MNEANNETRHFLLSMTTQSTTTVRTRILSYCYYRMPVMCSNRRARGRERGRRKKLMARTQGRTDIAPSLLRLFRNSTVTVAAVATAVKLQSDIKPPPLASRDDSSRKYIFSSFLMRRLMQWLTSAKDDGQGTIHAGGAQSRG